MRILQIINNIRNILWDDFIGFIYIKYRVVYSPIFIISCSNVSGFTAIARKRTL